MIEETAFRTLLEVSRLNELDIWTKISEICLSSGVSIIGDRFVLSLRNTELHTKLEEPDILHRAFITQKNRSWCMM